MVALATTAAPAAERPIGLVRAVIDQWGRDLGPLGRAALINPLLKRMPAGFPSRMIERERRHILVDWVVREHMPTWLSLLSNPRDMALLASLEIDPALAIACEIAATKMNKQLGDFVAALGASDNKSQDVGRVLDICDPVVQVQIREAWRLTGKAAVDAALAWDPSVEKELDTASKVAMWCAYSCSMDAAFFAVESALGTCTGPSQLEDIGHAAVVNRLEKVVDDLEKSLAACLQRMLIVEPGQAA